jgi:endo-1,4-beta-xylanase
MDRRTFLKTSVAMAPAWAGLIGREAVGAANRSEALRPTLRAVVDDAELFIGAAVKPGLLEPASPYVRTLAQQFNMLVAENAMKPAATQPRPGRFDFSKGDRLLQFARRHDQTVRGHTLLWHKGLPQWMGKRPANDKALERVMSDHIQQLCTHWAGQIYAWDVVNEAFTDEGEWRQTRWYRALGEDYLAASFQWARGAEQQAGVMRPAKLFYNDYGIEPMNAKSDRIYDWISQALKDGVPVDGIGFQMHISAEAPPDLESFAKNLRRFAELGLELHITEMDVRLAFDDKPSQQQLRRQATVYRQVLETALANEAVRGVLFWGFTDRYSWIPHFFDGHGAALPLDRGYDAKPAFEAVRDVLRKATGDGQSSSQQRNAK